MDRRIAAVFCLAFLVTSGSAQSLANAAPVTPVPNATATVESPIFPGMTGIAPDSVPGAPDGTIAVVASSTSIDPDGETLTVIVHNNTSKTVWVDGITTWLLNDYGDLVLESTDYFLTSHVLEPGEFSVGLVYGISFLIDLDALEFQVVTGSPHVSFDLAQTALDTRALSRNESTFSGMVYNQTGVFVTLYFVHAFCMSDEGQPLPVQSVHFDGDGMLPGEVVPFETEAAGLDLSSACPAYLLGTLADNWTRTPKDVFS